MRKFSWKTFVALAVAGAGLGASSLMADEPADAGVVRLPNEPVPGGKKIFTIQPPIKTVATPTVPESGLAGVAPCDNCGSSCGDSCHGHGCGGLLQRLHVSNHGNYSTPIEAWLLDRNAVTYPPDYGWSRPIKRPILNRVPVQYYKMDPDYWYGDPRAFQGVQTFPMVYQPTDTTQLGFSYQRVPTWQPNPNMLPAPPWPSTWHARECPGYTRMQQANFVNGAPDYGGYPAGYNGGEVIGVPPNAPMPAELPHPAKPAPAKDAKKLTPGDLKRSAAAEGNTRS